MTSTRALARHRSAAVNPTMTALTASVATGARRYRRRSAVIAASSGLVVTMGLPAAAVTAPQVDEAATASVPAVPAAPVETTTATVSVDPTAEIQLAMDETTSVDSSVAEQAEADAAAAARAAADRAAAEQAARASATSAALVARGASVQASRSTDRTDRTDRTVGGAVVATAAVAPAAVAAPSASGGGAIAIGQRYTGTPYLWGGTTPAGFDCSGFIQYVYRQMGVSLPRTAAAQQGAGRRVSASEARPGDIISFTGSGGVYHNGLYVGNGQMLDSPRAGKSIAVRGIWSSAVTFTRVG